MYQRSVSLFLSFFIGGTVCPVSPSVVQAVAQEPVPAHISANPPTLTLALGAKAQLTVSVQDAGGFAEMCARPWYRPWPRNQYRRTSLRTLRHSRWRSAQRRSSRCQFKMPAVVS